MVSKKNVLMLGALALGGIGLATMVSSGGGGGAAMEGLRQGRAGQILGSQQGYTSPGATIYNLPAQGAVTFPKAPTFKISDFLSPEPISRGTAGVSAAPKKKRIIKEGVGAGLGYKGYVTPITPTPVSPGYIPGVTIFEEYEKETYIPSPIKPPSVTYSKKSGGLTARGQAVKARVAARREK